MELRNGRTILFDDRIMAALNRAAQALSREKDATVPVLTAPIKNIEAYFEDKDPEKVGEGSFGEVYECVTKNQEYLVKVLFIPIL
jgi:hypothetical protein